MTRKDQLDMLQALMTRVRDDPKALATLMTAQKVLMETPDGAFEGEEVPVVDLGTLKALLG